MSQWDERYAREGWAFGTEPNDFLKEQAHRLPTLAVLREELEALQLAVGRELEREIHEGWMHTGRGAVVQVVGVRP